MLPAPLVAGVPTKTRLESRIKKFKPHHVYGWGCRSANAAQFVSTASDAHVTTPRTFVKMDVTAARVCGHELAVDGIHPVLGRGVQNIAI